MSDEIRGSELYIELGRKRRGAMAEDWQQMMERICAEEYQHHFDTAYDERALHAFTGGLATHQELEENPDLRKAIMPLRWDKPADMWKLDGWDQHYLAGLKRSIEAETAYWRLAFDKAGACELEFSPKPMEVLITTYKPKPDIMDVTRSFFGGKPKGWKP